MARGMVAAPSPVAAFRAQEGQESPIQRLPRARAVAKACGCNKPFKYKAFSDFPFPASRLIPTENRNRLFPII
jgi:hypothetical protein